MMKKLSCSTCGNGSYSIEGERWECRLGEKIFMDCRYGKYDHWVDDDTIETVINAQWLGENVAHLIFSQGKAKIFNVLESQIESTQKLDAAKRITKDIISDIAKNANRLIIDTLDDWQQEVAIGGELSPEEEAEAKAEYDEFKKAVK